MKKSALRRFETHNSILTIVILFLMTQLVLAKTTRPVLIGPDEVLLATQTSAQEPKLADVRELKQGPPIEREMSVGDEHTYRVSLSTKVFLNVVVEQKGIDVLVILFGPNGQKLTEADSPNGSQGPEPVSVIAAMPGEYRLVVRSLEAKAARGSYQIRIAALRESTDRDRDQIALERTLAEGERLRVQGTAESLRGAIEKYSQAVPLLRAMLDRQGEAATLNRIGVIYWQSGDNQKALEYYSQAQMLWRALGDRRNEATSLHNVGTVYMQLGADQKALEYYSQALPLWHAVEDRRAEATTLSALGVTYMHLGALREALDYYNQSLPLRRAVGDFWGEANTLSNIGTAYLGLGDLQKALEYENKALLLSREIGHRRGEAIALSEIGECYSSMDKPAEALSYLDQALTLHRTVGDRNGEVNTLQRMARAELARGRLNEARALIETALDLIESLRGKIASQELRSSYVASKQDYYEFYIGVLMRLHREQPAGGFDGASLEASERARARSLLEILTEARAGIRQGADTELLERERSTQHQLIGKSERLTRLLSVKHTEAQEQTARKEVEDLLADYQDVEAQIRVKNPRYAALTQPQPLSLKEIQQQVIDDDTLLLEYSLGDERSYLWAVTRSSITSFQLPKRAEIETAAKLFYELVTGNENRAIRRQTEAAAALAQLLLAPVARELGQKRLLIVSDGALAYVPFAALPDPSLNQVSAARSRTVRDIQRPKHYQPLIVQHEIVQVPSASVLGVLRQQTAGRVPAANTVAVLADPVFQRIDPRVKQDQVSLPARSGVSAGGSDEAHLKSDLKRSTWESGMQDLQRLPFSRREAEAIISLAGTGQSLKALDFDASRATVMSDRFSKYRIIHFATHGLLNNVHPELSGIVLSLVDETGQPQDGFLRLHEIYNLNLPAELVVLSGCQTALGKQVKGEGLVGLTRGFMYAGATRLVVSLWEVNDEATAALMKGLYEGMLKKGMRPAAALRTAQLAMWKSKWWNAPYYWGGFVMQGEWR